MLQLIERTRGFKLYENKLEWCTYIPFKIITIQEYKQVTINATVVGSIPTWGKDI